LPKKKRTIKHPKPIPLCPECGASAVVPILHGIITPALQKSIAEGNAVRADREEWEGMTEWYCKQCGCDWSGQWRRFKQPTTFGRPL